MAGSVCLAALMLLGGCPSPYEYVAGGTGDVTRLGDQALVQVVSPVADLAITGGTPVEVNWTAVATTSFAGLTVILTSMTTPTTTTRLSRRRTSR